MTKDLTALLHPVTFGCCHTCSNEKCLHSHLGKAFGGDIAMNKCHHVCFGQQFVWVTDCYALKFISSYDSWNPSILHLQMQFMCWDMIIKHLNNVCLTNAGYFSQVSADLCYDPLLKKNFQETNALHCCSPAPTKMPIAPEFQPYFCGPHINSPKSQPPLQGLTMHANVATIPATASLQHLQNWPVSFGCFPQSSDAGNVALCCLNNSKITRAASMLAHFDWAIYGINSSHFLSTINEHGYLFLVVLACNPFVNGHTLFWELSLCSPIHSSAASLLDHIQASGMTSKVTGYLIHYHCYYSSKPIKRFWEMQCQIVKQLESYDHFPLSLHSSIQRMTIAVSTMFINGFWHDGWLVTNTVISFPDTAALCQDQPASFFGCTSTPKPTANPLSCDPPHPSSPAQLHVISGCRLICPSMQSLMAAATLCSISML
jgi:hypothetical protein